MQSLLTRNRSLGIFHTRVIYVGQNPYDTNLLYACAQCNADLLFVFITLWPSLWVSAQFTNWNVANTARQQTAQFFTLTLTLSLLLTHTHTHFKGTRDGHLPAQWDAFCTKTTMLKYWHSESTEEPKAGERTHRPGRGYRNEMISWSANSRNNKLYVLIIDDTFFFLFLFSFSSASFNKAFWTLI